MVTPTKVPSILFHFIFFFSFCLNDSIFPAHFIFVLSSFISLSFCHRLSCFFSFYQLIFLFFDSVLRLSQSCSRHPAHGRRVPALRLRHQRPQSQGLGHQREYTKYTLQFFIANAKNVSHIQKGKKKKKKTTDKKERTKFELMFVTSSGGSRMEEDSSGRRASLLRK